MKAMPLRGFFRLMKQEGFVKERSKGKHEIWKHPDGRVIAFPHSPNADVVGTHILRRVLNKEV